MQERQTFEPFGERLSPAGRVRQRGAHALTAAGAAVFWTVVCVVVVARAFWFDPGLFDRFDRLAALATSLADRF